jgi:hypothetical protein
MRCQIHTLFGICLVVIVAMGNIPVVLWGAEPGKEFLERLREEGMFDLATHYLEIYDKKGWLPASMKQDVKLERLMIIQDSLAAARTTKERDSRVTSLEAGFKDFYDSEKKHPRRSEAGLRLGNLSLDRGQRELKKLNDPAEKKNEKTIREAAQGAFKQAEAVFKSTQEDLAAIIKEMSGAKVASNDAEKVAQRKQYQGEYRQAQILQGLSLKLLATSYPVDSAQYKDGLKKADEQLATVISKATSATEIGAKTLSRLYRGDVQALMGQVEQALESYTPVADFDQDGIFRLWRVQATAAMVRLLGTEKGGKKFDVAIKRGSELIKQMAKNEQANPEWLDLQLAVAQARLSQSKELEKKKGNDTASKAERREAREMLQSIARRPGDHQDAAKKLLSELGIEAVDPVETKIPTVKNFSEAFTEAKTRLERSESTQLSKEILRNRLQEVSDKEKPEIEAELKTVDANADRDRNQSMALLQRALKLYRAADSRDDLLSARFYVAYLFIKQDKFWEAAATADFVARSAPGTDTSLKACGFALFSYRKIMDSLPEERQANLMNSLEGLAKYMIATWPEAEETQQATLTLLQNALKNQRWDDAERFLTFMPKATGQSNATRRDLGYVLWIQFLISQDAERKAGKEPATGDIALRDRAERLLAEGWESLDVSSLDQRAVESAAALASLYLRTDRREKAEVILKKEKIGPIAAMEAKGGPVKEPSVRLEVLRLSLQLKVMAASAGGATLDAKEVEKLVKSMQASAAGNEKLLTDTLLTLAKDLREQLEQVQNPADQAKLASGIQVLLTQLSEVSDGVGILDWAGTTMWQLATGLGSKKAAAPIAKQLNASAARVFEKMLAAFEKDKAYFDAIQRKPEDITLKLSLALRGQGEFAKAHEVLLRILKANSTHLTAQIEAAKNYQEWSGDKDIDLLKKSIFGSDPNAQNKNTIWGWGQMSKLLSSQMGNREELKAIFFEARLQLATVRRLIANATPAGAARDKLLQLSLEDVRQTYKIYPDLGGKESSKNFDKLTKDVQKDLNLPVSGLEGL